MFCPHAVGVIPNYPKTEEEYERRRWIIRDNVKKWMEANGGKHPTRKGVPDGWAHKKKKVARIRARLQEEAKELVQIMVDKGIVDAEAAANGALTYAVSVVRDTEGTHQARERLAAARLVLDFTRSKPAQKVEATVTKAEDFLAALAKGS